MTVAKAKSHATRTSAANGDTRIKSLIALIDVLTALVAEENVELAKGLPASRLKQVDGRTARRRCSNGPLPSARRARPA